MIVRGAVYLAGLPRRVWRQLKWTLPDYGGFLAVSALATWILYELALDLLKRGGWLPGSWESLLLPSVLAVLPLAVALHGERRGWLDAYREVAQSARGFRGTLTAFAAVLALVALMNRPALWVGLLRRLPFEVPGLAGWGAVSRLPWPVAVFYAGLWLVDVSWLWPAFRPGESELARRERLSREGIRELEFSLRNRGPGVVTVRAESRAAWVSIAPREAVLLRDRKQAFRVTVQARRRPPGEAGAIRVWAPGAGFERVVELAPKARGEH